MEFRKQDLLHEIDVVWLSSLESSKLYASCMQCNAIFKSVIVLYFFLHNNTSPCLGLVTMPPVDHCRSARHCPCVPPPPPPPSINVRIFHPSSSPVYRIFRIQAAVAAQPPCNYVIRPGQAWHPWPSAQQPPAQGQTSYCCYHSLVLDSRLAAG